MKNIHWVMVLTVTLMCCLLLNACGTSGSSSSVDNTSINTNLNASNVNSSSMLAHTQPNILLIIADDQGLDASAQYNYSSDLPNTPTLNNLAAQGLVFDNAWATPACTTTRGTIITGKYGHNSGVSYVPAVLSASQQTLQAFLASQDKSKNYRSAVFGKWHLGGGSNGDPNHPKSVGIDYYAGNLGNVGDYYHWPLTINGETSTSTTYNTTQLTDLAIDWIGKQSSPWFTWLAYSAPHAPMHLPPNHLHQRNLSGDAQDISDNPRAYYLAAIEAMDSEISRLLASLDQTTLANTVVIYLGDNGTPKRVLDYYRKFSSKGTLYQGGVAVPLIVSGYGVNRKNEREDALVTATDLFATIANLAGVTPTRIHDSHSFAGLLTNEDASQEDYIFTEYESFNTSGWAVRSKSHKLITYEDGSQEFYALNNHFLESDNLLPVSGELATELEHLTTFAKLSTGEHGKNPIDITNAILTNGSGNCADYAEQYSSNVLDVNNNAHFTGDLVISVLADKCIFKTNAIPNHDFNDGGRAFPNDVSEQDDEFEITTQPQLAAQTTALSLQTDNAIMLNGVKVDVLAAGCYGIANGKIGCNDMNQPWRYDPMHAANGFNVDSHNAHAQPDGTYHYHGSPLALFQRDDNNPSPVVGFAADGFPIFGSYFDDNGQVRKAKSSYRLKAGSRPAGDGEPGGTYDGTFRDDYVFVAGLGDLDMCNGMTVNGVYGYYITDTYPYVLGCFSGTPDSSFNKR